jgi:hypothetical protein
MKTTLKRLPRGAGSMQKRGRTWWMIYTDAGGIKIQENSRTDDPAVARMLLAERALRTANAKAAAIQAIIDEAAQKVHQQIVAEYAGTEAGEQAGTGRRSRIVRRSVRNDAASVRTKKKGTRE